MQLSKKWLARLPLPEALSITPVAGGDVNQAFRYTTTKKDYMLLVQPHQPASFYAGEVAGLKAFAQANITAPRVIAHGQSYGDAYLVLSYLEAGHGAQSDLGHLVAKLHQYKSPNGRFGFTHPYVGTSVSFANPWSDSWTTIFVHQRLDVLDAALSAKHAWGEQRPDFLKARQHIIETLNAYPSHPVLLHGDLWAGNVMFLADGQPALIDPAAWYGDAEFDLGITTVFGGFDDDFYRGYQSVSPFAPGYRYRWHFYRLYYLMVHLDKFGDGYADAVAAEIAAINEKFS